MHEILKPYPVVITIPVAWGEMDAFQHVNNVIYFKYFESVRIAFFERLDMVAFMETTGIGPILASTQCKYKVPLTYPDTVSVGARVSFIEEDRCGRDYVLVSHKPGAVAAQGDGQIVAYDYRKGAKALIPEEMKQKILSVDSREP